MSRVSRADDEAVRLTRQVAARAVRRLDALEWILLGVAGLAAVAGGALVAAMVAGPLGLSFRSTWIAASLLVFVVPGAVALRRATLEDAAPRSAEPKDTDEPDESHG